MTTCDSEVTPTSAGAGVARRAPMQRLAILALTACTTGGEPEPAPDPAATFEFEPGLFVPLVSGGKADLPNGAFSARSLDTSGYRAIANRFVAAHLDVKRTQVQPAFDWPLADSRTVLDREGTPICLANQVYEHTGLDVIRASEMESAVVHAPVGGTAQITDWSGGNAYPNGDYSTVISIWDPETHLVVEVMHVKPDAMLPRTGTFTVTRGQVIGELADIGIVGGRHTHVNVVDAERFELIDPVLAIPSYPDKTKPTIEEVYLLDEMAMKRQTLKTGALDVVVSAFDRDDQSPRNLEVESIAFEAVDQAGNRLARLDRCHFSDAFEELATDWSMNASTIRLIDFGNASGQVSGFWPSADIGNPSRLFRYAVTNLRLVDGRCSVVANDRDGQLAITDAVTSLTLTLQLWDARGNHEMKTVTIGR